MSFKQISRNALVFTLLTLNWLMPAGIKYLFRVSNKETRAMSVDVDIIYRYCLLSASICSLGMKFHICHLQQLFASFCQQNWPWKMPTVNSLFSKVLRVESLN